MAMICFINYIRWHFRWQQWSEFGSGRQLSGRYACHLSVTAGNPFPTWRQTCIIWCSMLLRVRGLQVDSVTLETICSTVFHLKSVKFINMTGPHMKVQKPNEMQEDMLLNTLDDSRAFNVALNPLSASSSKMETVQQEDPWPLASTEAESNIARKNVLHVSKVSCQTSLNFQKTRLNVGVETVDMRQKLLPRDAVKTHFGHVHWKLTIYIGNDMYFDVSHLGPNWRLVWIPKVI